MTRSAALAVTLVAGAAALVLQAYPGMLPADLATWIQGSSTVDRGTVGLDNVYGAGELVLPPFHFRRDF